MVLAGTKSFPSYRLEAEAIEKYGGWHYAFTWIETQKHIVHLPQNRFREGIAVLLESIFAPLIREKEVEKEKGVVKEEILKNKSSPQFAIWDYVWFPLFFQGTTLARPYSGQIEDVERISRVDIDKFIKNYFCPENIVLLVAGDLDTDYIETTLEKEIGILLKNVSWQRPTSYPPIKPIRKNRVQVFNDPSYYKTSVVVGVETVPVVSAERHVLNIIGDMLGGYVGSRLVQRLRDEGGLIYNQEIYQDNISDIGYLVFHTSTDHANVEKVIKIILEEFRRLSNGEFEEEELEIARGHLVGSMLANIERGQDYVEWYGFQELLNPKNILSIEDQIKIYEKITIEEVKQIASDYLAPQNILIGVLGKCDKSKLSGLLK
jgi:predicted Zn-dependent peptidase